MSQSFPFWRNRCELTVIFCSIAVGLAGCLVLIRAYTMGITVASLKAPWDVTGQLLTGMRDDFFLIGIVYSCSILALNFAPPTSLSQRIVQAIYICASVIVLICAIANVTVVDYLGAPLSYQWLYYSDFGTATDIQTALAEVLTPTTLLRFPIGLGILVLASYLSVLILRRFESVIGQPALALFVAVILFFPTAVSALQTRADTPVSGRAANAVLYFLESLATKDDSPLLTMNTSANIDGIRVVEERPRAIRPDHPLMEAGIRNVLIFVMESVSTRYVEPYGGKFSTTPNLSRYADQAVVFENIYTHSPNSHKALMSVLTSTYPLISYKTLTKETPRAALPSMSSLLKQFDYQTAFFYSADLRYSDAEEFLRHQAFDEIRDFRTMKCSRAYDLGGGDTFLRYSVDDRCTAQVAGDWIRVNGDQPFLAIVWTNMTHIPYYADSPKRPYTPEQSDLNRYLNALHHGDEALGRILEVLEENDLFSSTLVIVTSDHGQAFGEHNQRGHAANLYQENIHVPLVLINPILDNSEVNDIVGGLIDIGPTVFSILDLPPSPLWQGNSLFAQHHPSRTYFFSMWGDIQFGFRHNDEKFIFNATGNICQVFNLAEDPKETRVENRLGETECRDVQEQLAAWVQYQRQLTLRSTPMTAR